VQRVEDPAPGFDLLPSNGDLTAAEVGLFDSADRERRLAKVLSTVAHDYELIIIDCPPSLNMLTVNALVAAHGVLIPIQCEYYALEGLSALLDTIEQIRASRNATCASRASCAPCTIPETIWPTRSPPSSSPISPIRSIAPSSRATCA
jgi:chromosome partitioning protein